MSVESTLSDPWIFTDFDACESMDRRGSHSRMSQTAQLRPVLLCFLSIALSHVTAYNKGDAVAMSKRIVHNKVRRGDIRISLCSTRWTLQHNSSSEQTKPHPNQRNIATRCHSSWYPLQMTSAWHDVPFTDSPVFAEHSAWSVPGVNAEVRLSSETKL